MRDLLGIKFLSLDSFQWFHCAPCESFVWCGCVALYDEVVHQLISDLSYANVHVGRLYTN